MDDKKPAQMTPYQERIAAQLRAGCTMQKRWRLRGYGIMGRYKVTVLIDPNGEELETVYPRAVERLVEAGYVLEEADGNYTNNAGVASGAGSREL